MSDTLTFTTTGPVPEPPALASWLTEQGEPFEEESPAVLALRALPVRLVFGTQGLRAEIDIAPGVPLTRLVRVLFELSVRVGADVKLAGVGPVDRSALWVRFAEEHDRLQIAAALRAAEEHHIRDEILTNLWSMLCALGEGLDLRWDPAQETIVEVRTVHRTAPLDEDDQPMSIDGDEPTPVGTVAVPVRGHLHMLVWRWMCEAFPSVAGHR